MNIVLIIGSLAATLTTAAFLPQVIKTHQTRHTKDLSLTFLYFVSAQSVFLILYGIARPDNYVLIMNIFPLICAGFLIGLKLKYK